VSCREPPHPVLSTTSLFDEEDTAEEWAARTPDNSPVGGGPHTGEYIDNGMTSQRSHTGTLLQGYARIVVGNIVAYSNGKPKRGTDWHSDGSKLVKAGAVEVHRPGTAVTCGDLKVIARVQGPQTSYRAELQGAGLFAAMADDGDTLTLDNKAVVDHGSQYPHREASDMDYRVPLADALSKKKVTLKWIPGHRQLFQARNAAEREEIRRNNEVDRLAKKDTRLPLEEVNPTQPYSIVVDGAEAPTPAKKWINAFRRYGRWTGCHWTTWLPMRGTRRMLWLQWLWGNVRWEGCAAPWEKSRAECSVCREMHGQTVHKRIVQCTVWKEPFLKAWAATWDCWKSQAELWIASATEDDMTLISMLRIPESFIEAIAPDLRGSLRKRVSWHQYHMLHEVVKLRGTLPMPQRCNAQSAPATSASAWYASLRARKVTPNPTPQVLAEQTLYRPKVAKRERKRPQLTEAQALLRLIRLERRAPTSATREAAILIYQTVNQSWPHKGLIKQRLSKVASQPWLTGRKEDISGGVVTPATAPAKNLVGPLNTENALTMEAMVEGRRATLRRANEDLCYVHQLARRWLKWWTYHNAKVDLKETVKAQAYEKSSKAVQAQWGPLQWWMGRVHMGLHDLEVWERRTDGGHVHARIQKIYLESCRQASSRWRREFARRQSVADTNLIGTHWHELERMYWEAAAQVEARYNYDSHDCLHLTGVSPGTGQGP